jgi:hypothetical protein
MIQVVQTRKVIDTARTVNFVMLLSMNGKPIGLIPMPGVTPKRAWMDLSDHTVSQVKSSGLVPFQSGGGQQLLTLVENALKRLHDFSYLGKHPLNRLLVVRLRCARDERAVTSLERAKTLSAFLAETIEGLRPPGPLPGRSSIPRREWYPYLVLHHAYVQAEHNYTIMNWLQISEGTFNRTRRGALQIIADTVAELECQALAAMQGDDCGPGN